MPFLLLMERRYQHFSILRMLGTSLLLSRKWGFQHLKHLILNKYVAGIRRSFLKISQNFQELLMNMHLSLFFVGRKCFSSCELCFGYQIVWWMETKWWNWSLEIWWQHKASFTWEIIICEKKLRAIHELFIENLINRQWEMSLWDWF